MKNIWFLLLSVAVAGCGLFKNIRTETRYSRQQSTTDSGLNLAEEKNWLSKSGTITLKKDSDHLDYAIQLWPKGRFTFSPTDGFSGEAVKILIAGSDKKGSQESTLSNNVELDKGKITASAIQQVKQVEDDKSKMKVSDASWKWMIGALVLVTVIGWLIRQKLTKL